MYCIYRITNLVNGKTYIGKHKYKKTPYDKYMGSGKHLKAAQAKYGIDNFVKDIIIADIEDKETINILEIKYIAYERASNGNGCYNITNGGDGCDYWEGKHRSDETKAKMSAAHKGKKLSEEAKSKLSAANKGKPSWNKGKHLSEETKAKLSAAKKGKKRSEEWRAKIGAAHKGKHWNLSEETKAKLSAAQKGNQNAKGKFKERHWKLVNGKRVWY